MRPGLTWSLCRQRQRELVAEACIPASRGVSAVSGSGNWSPKPTVAGFTGRPADPASGGGT